MEVNGELNAPAALFSQGNSSGKVLRIQFLWVG
jgi:hypothetical protein